MKPHMCNSLQQVIWVLGDLGFQGLPLPRAGAHVPAELRARVAALLAAQSSRRVYVTVLADGPTRVLRLSDVRARGDADSEQSILDLAARLRQVTDMWRFPA